MRRHQWLKWVALTAALLAATIGISTVLSLARLEASVFGHSATVLIERSRALADGAKPEYQDEVVANLPGNSLTGSYYRLDDLVRNAEVLEKPELPSADGNTGVIFSYEFDQPNSPGLVPLAQQSTVLVKGGMLRVEQGGRDYLVNDVPIEIPKDDVADIIIRLRADEGTEMMMKWTREEIPSDDRRKWGELTTFITPDDEFHTYIIDAQNALRRSLSFGDVIKHIRFRPTSADGAVVEIDFIRFISQRAAYAQAIHGADYATVGAEMRPILYMLPDQTIEYQIRVPEHTPTLDFGTAILKERAPLRFQVSIVHEEAIRVLHNVEIADASRWHDARLDLTRWAGEEIRIRLTVTNSGNVGFWSNPIVYSQPDKPFNVIILLEDTLRADRLSVYGHTRPTSPTKDRLMREGGIIFQNAVSQATMTRPSVLSMMTSLLPTATGVWNHTDMLADEFLTLPELMRAQGFVTASFVQNNNAGPAAGLHQGFSSLLDEETIGLATEMILGDRLNDWLARNSDRNFFLYLHILDPHSPYEPPAPYDRWYREASNLGPLLEESEVETADPQAKPTATERGLLYDGEIAHNDSVLDGFLRKLESLGLTDHSLLILTSDHGEYLGERGTWGHYPPGHLQVTGVPLMFVYPERFKAPKRIPQTVQLTDVMPTVLEFAGIETEGILLQGDSLQTLIDGERLDYWNKRIAVSEEPSLMPRNYPSLLGMVYPAWYPWGSLFFRDRHLISSRMAGPQFLPSMFKVKVYDLETDREEKNMLYSSVPDLYSKHMYVKVLREVQANNRTAWKRWTAKSDSGSYKIDPDALKQLRALGYIN